MHKILPLLLLLAACSSSTKLAPSRDDVNAPDILTPLASPAFDGRGVGTKGLEKARDLLVKTLQEGGIQPGFLEKGRDGTEKKSYTQGFRVFIGNEQKAGNRFAGSKKDFLPLAFSKSGKVEKAELVFAGFGITVRHEGGISYDDYAGIDAKGKIVIALMGDPGTGNKESKFRNPAYQHYSGVMYKVQNAEQHGAAGIVLVRDPLSLSGTIEPALRFQSRQGGGTTSAILAGQASIKRAEGLLGKNLRKVQEQIAASQKPASFAVSKSVGLAIELERQLGATENVAGLIPGKDPKLAQEYIVLGAHYDHLGFGGDHSMDPDGTGKPHVGADDNASGVQGVMDLAYRFQVEGGLRRPLLVVFFSAEEVGLLGSKQFMESLPLPAGARVVAMVNLDMIGRLTKEKLSALAVKSSAEFAGLVDQANQQFQFDLGKADSGFGSSDHTSFLLQKVPSLFFTTGAHSDYHRPSDTSDKINREGLRKVGRLVHSVMREIDKGGAPTYDAKSEEIPAPTRGGRGYGVYFGSVPEFREVEGEEGVPLQAVRADSPAEHAGLKGGDLLTGLGEIRIKNLHDLVFALRFYRANETVEVSWMRGGKRMTGKTVLKNREEQR